MNDARTLIATIDSFPSRTGMALIHKNGYRTLRYSYADLHTLVRRCASWYETRGVRAGDRVALWGANSPEWVVAFLGAVYVGAIPVPLDIQATTDAVAAILEHATPKLLLRSSLKTAPSTVIPAVELEGLLFDIQGMALRDGASASETGTVEIVYTSGTTGNPKGVVLSHGNITSNVRALLEHLSVDDRDSVLSPLPFSHMFGQTCGLLAPLTAGMPVITSSVLTANSLFSILKTERVTVLLTVPRVLQGIRAGIEIALTETRSGRFVARLPQRVQHIIIRRRFGTHLRFLVSGGAALDSDTARFFKTYGITVIAGYGLTETSPILSAETGTSFGGTTAGTPLPGVEIRIAEDGEILARGAGVFREYYKEPAKTTETFRDGYFLTGDLGAIGADGTLTIKGRKKETIVTAAGVNVYPDDIEPILNALPGVRESCVVGIAGTQGEEVHAVVIPTSTSVDLTQLMRTANDRLNSSQRIATIAAWPESEFPKTSTMKIKRSLVRASIQHDRSPLGSTADTSKVRRLIAQVVGKPVENVHMDARLYEDLKLDSIGRIELASLITQEYFFDFDEDSVTNTTTVGELETLVATRTRTGSRFRFPLWPHYRAMILARILGMELINATIARLFVRETVRGREHLRGLQGPVIFAANHISYADHPIIFRALPLRFRYRIAAPAFAEFFFIPKDSPLIARAWKRFAYLWGAATMALFPASQSFSSRATLIHAGMLIDKGDSILIFPEGERTTTEAMLPLRKGTAILIKNLRVPVVPIGHRGLEYVFPRGAALPKFGRAQVHIGAPIVFGNESIEAITDRLAKEIDALRNAECS